MFFGDQRANAYAVDAITGRLIWKRKVDDYPSAAITGAPTIQDGKVFVPVQGLTKKAAAAAARRRAAVPRKPDRAQRRHRRRDLEDLHGGRTEAAWNEHAIGTGSLRSGRRRHLVVADRGHEAPHVSMSRPATPTPIRRSR